MDLYKCYMRFEGFRYKSDEWDLIEYEGQPVLLTYEECKLDCNYPFLKRADIMEVKRNGDTYRYVKV